MQVSLCARLIWFSFDGHTGRLLCFHLEETNQLQQLAQLRRVLHSNQHRQHRKGTGVSVHPPPRELAASGVWPSVAMSKQDYRTWATTVWQDGNVGKSITQVWANLKKKQGKIQKLLQRHNELKVLELHSMDFYHCVDNVVPGCHKLFLEAAAEGDKLLGSRRAAEVQREQVQLLMSQIETGVVVGCVDEASPPSSERSEEEIVDDILATLKQEILANADDAVNVGSNHACNQLLENEISELLNKDN